MKDMNIAKLRQFLKRNKIFLDTITALLLSSMAIALTVVQVGISRNQLILSVDPVLWVEPSRTVSGAVGDIKIEISNLGIAELYEIEVYESYFVTQSLENKTVQLAPIGKRNIYPNTKIKALLPDETKDFNVDFKYIVARMEDFYRNRKGLHMKVCRLILKYRRRLDGKRFSQSKFYIIAGHGDSLVDFDEMDLSLPGMANLKDVLGGPNK